MTLRAGHTPRNVDVERQAIKREFARQPQPERCSIAASVVPNTAGRVRPPLTDPATLLLGRARFVILRFGYQKLRPPDPSSRTDRPAVLPQEILTALLDHKPRPPRAHENRAKDTRRDSRRG